MIDELHEETFTKTVFGFWLYLMSDCLLFATLFCTFAVLHNQVAGSVSAYEIINLRYVFIETMILLFSSLTTGIALLSSLKNKKTEVLFWLILSSILGLIFVAMEYFEFKTLIDEGHTFQKSAFLSSYFTLVGTHGLHVSFGLLWLVVMIAQVIYFGITVETFRRLVIFNMFWHFLDLVWIFIFTFVYLLQVI